MSASAPGKAILFGEHAVVYGRPAIAVPVHALQARAELTTSEVVEGGMLWIEAPEVGFSGAVDLQLAGSSSERADLRQPGGGSADEDAPKEPPADPVAGLALAVERALEHFGATPEAIAGDRSVGLRLEIRSEIPVAAGLGSSAAVTVAVLRAAAEYLGESLPAGTAAELALKVEQHYHGTPSGIDSAVIAHGKPIYFVKGEQPTPLSVAAPITLVLADSGRAASTRQMVDGVRQRWEADRPGYEGLFDRIGAIAAEARRAIQSGQIAELGPLMSENQQLLEQLGVSTPQLEVLIAAAQAAGAPGAKLSGAGGGGLVMALATAETAEAIHDGLLAAGAARAFTTQIGS